MGKYILLKVTGTECKFTTERKHEFSSNYGYKRDLMIDVATGIARVLQQEGIEWVSTFPVCKVNNALGKENVPMIMMRDDRYAVALADGFSRVTAGTQIGVCTVQGGVNAAGLQVAYAGLAQAYEDGSLVLCITDGVPIGNSENSYFDVTSSLKSVSKWYGYIS